MSDSNGVINILVREIDPTTLFSKYLNREWRYVRRELGKDGFRDPYVYCVLGSYDHEPWWCRAYYIADKIKPIKFIINESRVYVGGLHRDYYMFKVDRDVAIFVRLTTCKDEYGKIWVCGISAVVAGEVDKVKDFLRYAEVVRRKKAIKENEYILKCKPKSVKKKNKTKQKISN